MEVFAAAATSFGTEHGSYSRLAKQDYMKILKETLWSYDNRWLNMAAAPAILFKGLRIDVEAIELLDPLRIWRRQLQRDASTRDLLQQAWELKSANPDIEACGVLSRLVHVVQALSLLELPLDAADKCDGTEPPLAEVLADARAADPVAPSRLPAPGRAR